MDISFLYFREVIIVKCNLCPRCCNVDRDNGEFGFCRAPGEMVIARYSLHQWEEPVISGEAGSGTIFFSYCNLRCLFCQNYEISEYHKGRAVTVEDFCDICLDLERNGALNINLVTPTIWVDKIIKGLELARDKKLKIPIVYNSSGYERVETLKKLDGYVDIYLPDFKYYSNDLSWKFSHCKDYFKVADKALEEMVRQVGDVVIDENGIMKKGVIVRHLLLPGHLDDSKKVIKYLYLKYQDKIIFSLMNQYTPVRECKYEELNRTVLEDEYDELINYAYDLGVRKAFIQEGESCKESFIPDFNQFRVI